ncbi:MAG TPA: extracellular solute-binding protein [Nocardioidaceae bacterium]|nr:extracellular solute-binding protein [Nocardioidaceae bacterium]
MVSRVARRRTLAAVGSVLTLAILAGCTGGDEPDTQPTTTPTVSETPEPVTLRLAVYGDETDVAMYQDIADAFTAANPDVTFEITSTSDASAAAEAALGAISSGAEAPDIFLLGVDQLAAVVQADAVQPVNELLEARDIPFGDGIQRIGLTAFSANASLACMPNEVSPMVAYFNTRLVKPRRLVVDEERVGPIDKGWEWEEFVAAARQAVALDPEAKGGFLPPDLEHLTPFLLSGGGRVVDEELDPRTLTLSDDGTRDALKTLAAFTRDRTVSLTRPEAAEQTPLERFAAGKLGVLFATRAVLPSLRAVPSLRFDIAPLPRLDGTESTATMSALCIAKSSEHVEEAADFIAFAVDGPGVEISAQTGATVPVQLDVLHSPVFLQPDQLPRNAQVYAESARRAALPPYSPHWTAARSSADAVLERVLYGRTIDVTSEETPELDELLQITDEDSQLIFDPPEPTETPTP